MTQRKMLDMFQGSQYGGGDDDRSSMHSGIGARQDSWNGEGVTRFLFYKQHFYKQR